MGNGGNTKLQSTIPPSSLFPQRGGWAQERAWPVERMMHLSGMRRGTMWLWVGLLALAGCKASSAPPKDEKTVTIFVAASTKEAVEKLAKDFTAETGIKVEVSPGPSSGLAKQIEQGAPADLFLSADQPMADYLAGKGLVEQRRVLLHNRLVVVVPAHSELMPKELPDLADPRVKKLALAEEKVPAGEYAREALRKAEVWDQVKDRVVGGSDVRVTLQHVENGVEAGLVYYTDTVGNTKVKVAFEVDPKLHKPIEYPLVLIKRPRIKEAARRFYEYLGSEKAAEVFRAANFDVPK